MGKSLWVSVGMVLILSMGFGLVNHGLVLEHDYAGVPQLFRSEDEQRERFPLMLVGHVFFAFGFVWLHQRAVEVGGGGSWVRQSLIFALAMAAVVVVSRSLIFHVVQPMPGTTAAKQIALDALGTLVMAMVVGWIRHRAS